MPKYRNQVYEDHRGIYWARVNGKRETPNTAAAAQLLYHRMLDEAERGPDAPPKDVEVIILRGVPGCGKTTWADEFTATHYWYKRISRDVLRQMFHFGRYDSQNEKFIRDMRKKLIRECVRDGWSVVVDDTNCKERDVWDIQNAAHAPNRHVDVRIVTFDTSLEECIRRDAAREHPVGEARIVEMWEQLNGRIMTPEFWSQMVEAVNKV